MDQFVVDLDGDDAAAGAEVMLFGTGVDGEPTAQDWAEACGTISYEIVTRIGGRFTRRYVDSEPHGDNRGMSAAPPHPRGRRRCRRARRGRRRRSASRRQTPRHRPPRG